MTKEQLSAQLRALREQKTILAEDIADITRLNTTTVYRVWRGANQDSLATYLLVSCAMGYLPPTWRAMLGEGRHTNRKILERAAEACEALEAKTTRTWDRLTIILLVSNIIMACIAIWVLSLPS